PYVRVSPHTAQAFREPLSHDPVGAQLLPDLRDTHLQPPYPLRGREGTRTSRPRHLRSLFRRFFKLSRDERPVGRRLSFAAGDVATGIRAITTRHSLLPTSQARTPFGQPYGQSTRPCRIALARTAEASPAWLRDVRGFHVPQLKYV